MRRLLTSAGGHTRLFTLGAPPSSGGASQLPVLPSSDRHVASPNFSCHRELRSYSIRAMKKKTVLVDNINLNFIGKNYDSRQFYILNRSEDVITTSHTVKKGEKNGVCRESGADL